MTFLINSWVVARFLVIVPYPGKIPGHPVHQPWRITKAMQIPALSHRYCLSHWASLFISPLHVYDVCMRTSWNVANTIPPVLGQGMCRAMLLCICLSPELNWLGDSQCSIKGKKARHQVGLDTVSSKFFFGGHFWRAVLVGSIQSALKSWSTRVRPLTMTITTFYGMSENLCHWALQTVLLF